MAPFDRKKAVQYAKDYWTIPCQDGFLGLENDRPVDQ